MDSAPETRRGHVSTGADTARQVGDVCLQPLAGLTSKNGHVRFLAKKKPPLQETLYKVEVSVWHITSQPENHSLLESEATGQEENKEEEEKS